MRPMQHARQRDIDREAGRAGDFGPAVLPRHRLADHGELGIRRQRRRFVDRDLRVRPRRDRRSRSERKCLACASFVGRHDQAFRALAAASVAATTCGYVPQRQMWPLIARRTSSARRVGRCAQQRRAAHHHAGRAEAALHGIVLDEGGLHGVQAHRRCARPSIVVTLRAPTSMANIMQEQTGAPSSQTVQAEQAPRLQAIFVPVRPSGPRSTSASVIARLDLEAVRARH